MKIIGLLGLFSFIVFGQVEPSKGLRSNPPRVWALKGANVHTEPNKILEDAIIIVRDGMIEKVGVEKAAELAIYYPDDNPVELPNGLEFNTFSIDEMYDSVAGPFLAKDMEGGGRGSNAWAVSPQLSETGRPILANDTHLVLSNPNVWYLNHLQKPYENNYSFMIENAPLLLKKSLCLPSSTNLQTILQ